jgi:beta-glucosidase
MAQEPVFTDATRSIDDRVDDLLGRMTVDEKVAQLGSYWVYEILNGTTFSPEKASDLLGCGIGQITRIGGASSVQPAESAELANTIQKFLLDNTRLGVPAVVHEECCSGYLARGATVFPQAIGVASTWEPDLVAEMTTVIRRQMRSVGAHHALAPVLDVSRDPRWGRTEETFGEDPYLTARIGVSYIQGLQGDDLKEGIVATGKHFVGYSMSEGGMNWAPPHIAEREMREVYLFPFEAAVREAKLASMMNAYNELDGVPCGCSKELLTDILRGEWGFDGTVVSDYFTVEQLRVYHHVAPDKATAARLALEAGLDVELPTTDCYGDPLREAVQSGLIRESLLDEGLRRVLRQKFATGVFEQPYVDSSVVVFDTAEDRQLAREMARKSIILLKNDGDVLPLSKAVSSIAVIGPNADMTRNLFGDYAYPAHIEALLEMTRGENVLSMPVPEGIETVSDFIDVVSVLDAIKNQVSPGTQLHYAQGCAVNDDVTAGFAAAVAAAKRADIAILVMGDKAGLTDDCTSGEARDRTSLDLPGVQEQLVKAIYDTGTPVVLVLVNGRPVTLNWMADDIPAILEAWFPAEEGANAIAEVLFGDVNPGGKLPISFPRSVGQIPVFYGHRPSGGRSHWKGDYVDSSSKPLYPFGYGLSYTQFECSNLQIEPREARPGETVSISMDVANVGARAGDEVLQLYTHQNLIGMTRPLKELKGFKRVTLEPGEQKTVTFKLAANQLGFYNRAHQFVVTPGTVDVMVGTSSADIAGTGTIEIVGDETDASAAKAFFSEASVQ